MTEEEYINSLVSGSTPIGKNLSRSVEPLVTTELSTPVASTVSDNSSLTEEQYLRKLTGKTTDPDEEEQLYEQETKAIEQASVKSSSWINNFIGGWSVDSRNTDIGVAAKAQKAMLSFENLDSQIKAEQKFKNIFNRVNLLPALNKMALQTYLGADNGYDWLSTEEQIGTTPEGWEKMSEPERMVQITKTSKEKIDNIYNSDTDSAWYKIGGFFGLMTTPSLALSMRSIPKMMAFGAVDASTYQYGQEGKVDVATPIIGATLAPAILLPSKLAYTTGKKITNKFTEKASKAKKDKMLQTIENEVNMMAASKPFNPTDPVDYSLLPRALDNLGIDSKTYDDIIQFRKPSIPANRQQALDRLEQASIDEVAITRKGKLSAPKIIDTIIEPIGEKINRISPRLYGKIMQIEKQGFEEAHKYTLMTQPFLNKAFPISTKLKGVLTKEQQNKLWLDMSNSKTAKDAADIRKFIVNSSDKGPALAKDWDTYRSGLDEIYKSRNKVRLANGEKPFNKIEGYAPRKMISSKLWYDGAPASETAPIDRILKEKYKINNPKDASTELLEDVIGSYFKSTPKNLKNAGSAKNRKIETLSEKQLNAYAKPWQATNNYIKESVQEIERYKVFGKSLDDGGDLDVTVKDFVARQLKNEKISPNDLKELKTALTARFINGPKQMDKFVQTTKDIGYMSLLGHPTNAVRQLADLASSAKENGIINASKGVLDTLSKGKMLSPKDMGLIDNVAQDFTSAMGTKRWVDLAFKTTGFRDIDAFGAGQRSIGKAAQQVKTPKGRQEFMKQWGAWLGPEDALKAADDFKAFNAGTIDAPTSLMKDIAFIKLSKIQPITLTQMPQAYLNMKNGRMMYMLQSFAMKHVNVIRQDVFKEYGRGNIKKATKELAKLAGYYTMANMGSDKVIDLMLGRDSTLENTFYVNAWRSSGLISKYDVDQLARGGDVYGWLTALPVPPLDPLVNGVMEALHVGKNLAVGDDWDAGMGGKGGKDILTAWPGIGRTASAWLYDN